MSTTVRVWLGDIYFVTSDDESYEVRVYREGEKLKKGYAYIRGDKVYPYRGKMSDSGFPKPGVYKVKGKQYAFVESIADGDEYSINRIVELNQETIFNRLISKPEAFYNPADLEIVNNNGEIYVPTIKPEDDFLKYLVKKIIIDKRINLRTYKDRFPNEYALNNMKSGLNRDTKMTVTNFKAWCEILGIEWEIAVRDSGTDKINPLPEDIIITSSEF